MTFETTRRRAGRVRASEASERASRGTERASTLDERACLKSYIPEQLGQGKPSAKFFDFFSNFWPGFWI